VMKTQAVEEECLLMMAEDPAGIVLDDPHEKLVDDDDFNHLDHSRGCCCWSWWFGGCPVPSA
jgi:hypothetical protein